MASPQKDLSRGNAGIKFSESLMNQPAKCVLKTKRMFAQWPGQKWAGSKWAVFMNSGGLLHLCCMRCKRKERHSRGQPFPKMIVILLYRCSPAARFCAGKRKPLPAPVPSKRHSRAQLVHHLRGQCAQKCAGKSQCGVIVCRCAIPIMRVRITHQNAQHQRWHAARRKVNRTAICAAARAHGQLMGMPPFWATVRKTQQSRGVLPCCRPGGVSAPRAQHALRLTGRGESVIGGRALQANSKAGRSLSAVTLAPRRPTSSWVEKGGHGVHRQVGALQRTGKLYQAGTAKAAIERFAQCKASGLIVRKRYFRARRGSRALCQAPAPARAEETPASSRMLSMESGAWRSAALMK